MTTFDERERAFEAKFAHDQEVQYLLLARRDKLYAQWAAAELKLSDQEGAALMQSVLHLGDGPGHDERLLAMISGRFTEAGQFPLDAYLAAALTRCRVEAEGNLLHEAGLGTSGPGPSA